MSWAEIKKALNSSIGTSDFKPLNEIIDGTKKLVASDNLYCVVIDQPQTKTFTSAGGTFDIDKKVKILWNGSIKITADFSFSGYEGTGQKYREFYIFKNGTKIIEQSYASQGEYTYTNTFSVKKGDEFTFQILYTRGSPAGTYESYIIVNSIEILSDVIDGSGVEVELI